MNFVLIRSEAGMRQHKLTWIVVIKFFSHQLIPSQPFLGHPLWFHNFFTLAILNRAALFFTVGLFLSEYLIINRYYLAIAWVEQGSLKLYIARLIYSNRAVSYSNRIFSKSKNLFNEVSKCPYLNPSQTVIVLNPHFNFVFKVFPYKFLFQNKM